MVPAEIAANQHEWAVVTGASSCSASPPTSPRAADAPSHSSTVVE